MSPDRPRTSEDGVIDRGAARPTVCWAEDADGDRVLIRSVIDGLDDAPRIQFSGDGVKLLDDVRKHRPQLVVLDINMPNMDGIEALRRLRQRPDGQDLPVIMFTTSSDPKEKAVCEELGATRFVEKPVAFGDFAKVVRGMLATARPPPRGQARRPAGARKRNGLR